MALAAFWHESAYSATRTYNKGAQVFYLGSTYTCLVDATIGQAPTTAGKWVLTCAGGNQGSQGATGATGATGQKGIDGLAGNKGSSLLDVDFDPMYGTFVFTYS